MIAFLEGDPLRVTAANAAARSRLGLHPGSTAEAAWTISALDELTATFTQVMGTGAPFVARGVEAVLLDSDGEPVEALLDVQAQPARTADGEVYGITLTCVDATAPALTPGGLVTSLQDAMMSEGLPLPPGLDLAAYYLIAEHGGGGDWFDAIALEDGRVALAVGDVVGHGLAATAVMSELRAIFDEHVRATGDIGSAIALLDRRAQRSPSARAATLCAVLLDPRTGSLTYCTAGHPPPLVVGPDGSATYLQPSGASPLSIGSTFPVAEHRLAAGDLLVLYTDGLLVRSEQAPDESTLELIRLAETVHEAQRSSADSPQRADRFTSGLLHAATRRGYDDDVTLLTARLTDQVPALELSLPAEPSTPREVRLRLGQWLSRLDVRSLDISALQHSVGELVNNAVDHAYHSSTERSPRPGNVDVLACHALDGLIEVTVTDHGTWRTPVRETERVGGWRWPGASATVSSSPRGREAPRLGCGTVHVATWSCSTGTTTRSAARASRELRVERPRAGVLALGGGIEDQAVDRLRYLLGQHSQGGTLPLLLDLSAVTFVSSAAIHALSTAQSWAPGLRLLAPLGTPAQQMLDLAGLAHLSSSDKG